MKIIFFTENFYEGGMDTFIISLLNNWNDKSDQLILVCNNSHSGKERYLKELDESIIQIYHNLFHTKTFRERVEKKYTNRLLGKILPKYISIFLSYTPLLELYYILAINRVFSALKPDRLMVVNGAYPGGITCRSASISFGLFHRKKNSFHNIHNFTAPYRSFSLFDSFYDKLILRKSTALISVSDTCISSLKLRKIFNGSRKLRYIYNGTNFKKSTKNTSTTYFNRLAESSNQKFCLMLGTYEERKGHLFLIEVLKKILAVIPNVTLVFSGFGTQEEKDRVRNLIKMSKLEEKVILLDFIRDIESLYASADLVLIGSQAYESFGLTAIEAMARKKPVVSTNTGGLKEVIKNGEGGYYFDIDDVQGFADKTIQLLSDSKLYKEQCEKGYSRFQNHFTIKRMVEQYKELIKS